MRENEGMSLGDLAATLLSGQYHNAGADEAARVRRRIQDEQNAPIQSVATSEIDKVMANVATQQEQAAAALTQAATALEKAAGKTSPGGGGRGTGAPTSRRIMGGG
jgi:hypothetical protein